LPETSLADRVVEVIADCGEFSHPRYRHGSGFLVAGSTVLTAAHVVSNAVAVIVRDRSKRQFAAAVDPRFIGSPDGPEPDLALLEIPGFGPGVSSFALAAVDRDSPAGDPVEDCRVIGFPVFMEDDGPSGRTRDSAEVLGFVPVLSRLAAGLLSVRVDQPPRALPQSRIAQGESEWKGMSGAPVIADGCLLGVVTEHAPREGAGAITATPLTALEADPSSPGWGPGVADPAAWWARLGVGGIGALRRLPASRPRPEPAYLETVREVRGRTSELVGRREELADINTFAHGSESYRRLVAGAWAGKTSLLAGAALALPDDVDVVCYFLSRRESDADSAGFLAALVPQLACLLDERPPGTDRHEFRALWGRAAKRAAAAGRHLLMIVDGLDEDLRPPGLASVAALLPAQPNESAHVLVSSRPYPELSADIPAGHPLLTAVPVTMSPYAGARELSALARQEIDDLLRRDDDGLTTEVLGVLTAAAGPLALADLATMTLGSASAAGARRIRKLLSDSAARSVERVGTEGTRYQFVHESLLAYAEANQDLNNPEYRQRIHLWARTWREAGWPSSTETTAGTPRYLLDTYPSTLMSDPRRLSELVSDVCWIEAAIREAGVNAAMAGLYRAIAADGPNEAVAAILQVVRGQLPNLSPADPLRQPGYILRQLCLQAEFTSNHRLAADCRARLRSVPGLMPMWTTRRQACGSFDELGIHQGARAVAALPGPGVVTFGADGRVLIWNPLAPGSVPLQVAGDGAVCSALTLSDGRIVTAAPTGTLRIWTLTPRGGESTELGQHPVPAAALPGFRGDDYQPPRKWFPVPPATPSPPPAQPPAAPKSSVAGMLRPRSSLPGGPAVVPPAFAKAPPPHKPVSAIPATASSPLPDYAESSPLPDNLVQALAQERARRRRELALDVPYYPWLPTAPGEADSPPVELMRLRPRPDRGLPFAKRLTRSVAMTQLRDGNVVTAGADGQILRWDPDSPGSRPKVVGSTPYSLWAVTALRDGRIVTVGADGRILAWNPDRDHASGTLMWVVGGEVSSSPRGHPVQLGRHSGELWAVAPLPDGRLLTVGPDGRLLAWDPDDPGRGPAQLGRHERALWAIAGPRRGPLIAVGDGIAIRVGSDGETVLWEQAEDVNRWLENPTSMDGQLWAVAAQADGRAFTVGPDGALLAWDAPGHGTTTAGGNDSGSFARDLTAVTVTTADQAIVACGNDGRVVRWTRTEAVTSAAALFRLSSPAHAITALPGGRIVTGNRDGAVHVWDPATAGGPVELGRHDGPVHAAAALPDGRVVTGGDDGRALIWNPAEPASAPAELAWTSGTARQPDPVRAVAVLPDGRIVTGQRGGDVLAWDPQTPHAGPLALGVHDEYYCLQTLTALDDGRIISAGEADVSAGEAESVVLWDSDLPDSGGYVRGMGTIDAMAALPGDRLITICPYKTPAQAEVTIWDMRTVKIIAELRCPAVTSVAAVPAAPGGVLVVLAHADQGFTVCTAAE
jgi:WD40 repeat protein